MKDASSVRNVSQIIKKCDTPVVVVASAMGKTTSALEQLTDAYFNRLDFAQHIEQVKTFHLDIVNELFDDANHLVFKELAKIFSKPKPHND